MTLQEQLAEAGFNSDAPTTHESSELEFENTSGIAKKYLSLTIEELVKVKGGIKELKTWTGILKDLKAIEKSEQDMKERRNELVEKDFIISRVKKYLDLFMSNAFDIVESQKKIISAHYKSHGDKAETVIEEMRKKSLTKISKEAVRSINTELRGLKRKYDASNPDD